MDFPWHLARGRFIPTPRQPVSQVQALVSPSSLRATDWLSVISQKPVGSH